MSRSGPRLYLVTDRRATAGRPLPEVVEAALRGGVDAVQLREKDLPTGVLCELALKLREITRRYGAKLLINDRIDVALAVDADGVHLPVDSFAIADARKLVGPERIVAASTHDLDQAHRAQRAGADFIVFGPVFPTPSKRAYGSPRGVAELRRVTQPGDIAVVAIGGITHGNTVAVAETGCAGLAVIRAILGAEDPTSAAASLIAAQGERRQPQPMASKT